MATLEIYSALMRAATPLLLARLGWRGISNRPYWDHLAERLGMLPESLQVDSPIWIHAVSVGEAQAAVPVARALMERFPESRLLVTTTTPTGRARVAAALGDSARLAYVPFDTPGAVARFLERVKPAIGLIMETELWPNLIRGCHARGIPVVLANARLSDRSARGYSRIARLTYPTLACVDAALAQTERDGRRLLEIGLPAERLHVTGSVKFEVRLPPSVREAGAAIRRRWGNERSVFIAASTHEGEERIVLDAHRRLLAESPRALLVLVPRHPERFGRVAELSRSEGFETVLHSESPFDCASAQVYVGDTMGDLPVLYAGADVAFVGGSLVDVGGHNVLEPAALGIPVLTGPRVRNFADITGRLASTGAARFVQDAGSLFDAARAWLDDANERHRAGQLGQDFVESNRGALTATVEVVERLLKASREAAGNAQDRAGHLPVGVGNAR